MVKVLAIGPCPPPFGGATVLFEQDVARLRTRLPATVNVVSTTARGSEISSIRRALRISRQVVCGSGTTDVVFLNASYPAVVKYLPVALGAGIGRKRRLVVRLFGGACIDAIDVEPRWKRHSVLWMLRRADAVLVETKAARRQALQLGLSAAWFPNTREPLLGGEVDRGAAESVRPFTHFLFLSLVSEDKGVDDLVACASQLGEAQVRLAGRWAWPGHTPGDLPTNVTYLGEISRDLIGQAIAACSAIVLPTRNKSEGYPGVVLEAFAAGRPVITTDVGGLPELVGDAAFLVCPGDRVELLEAMRAIQVNGELRRQLAEAGRRRVALFDPGRWADWLVGVLRNAEPDSHG